ncbi:zinc finger protein 260-like [Sinocyclocheilus anshuiensis]|uniref:zinc finger protein 260-like n=1 Tax=Sinocyclocheilus anshuiensis TaxID=1608454 RepID=UPI0007BA168E|nr:PREDICTED: zinc finger protein 260-like [Sinocyclocheilus anshuiensis]
MAFIKEETEDFRIEEVFSLKQEDTEEQTDLLVLKEENQDPNEMEQTDQYENHHDFITGENATQSKTAFIRKRAQKTKSNSSFTCLHCGRSFDEKRKLQMHVRVHTEEKPYTCQQCGKSFTQKPALQNHMRTHSGEKQFIKVYVRHNVSVYLLVLKEENQDLNEMEQTDQYEKHHDFITGEKSTQTKTVSIRKRAQKTKASSSFTCHHCGKSFAQQGALKTCHQRGKSFTQKSSLQSHMNIHTGVKPYTCEQCGKSFPAKQNLKVHMRVHTGEKPYSCKYCGKSFTNAYSQPHNRI